jgi:hypothetical protein
VLVQREVAEDLGISLANEDPLAFEALGSESLVQLVERAGGTKIVVLTSYDGNARVQAGVNESGSAICAIIET